MNVYHWLHQRLVAGKGYPYQSSYDKTQFLGLIVLAQHTDRQDADFGSQYTVKEYHSAKYQDNEGWHHQAITFKPKSDDPRYQPFRLVDDELSNFLVSAYLSRFYGRGITIHRNIKLFFCTFVKIKKENKEGIRIWHFHNTGRSAWQIITSDF